MGMHLHLQNIIKDISFENLPAKWQGFDFSRFSKNKTLFDFQKQDVQNALKGLWLYFKDKKADKQRFFNIYFGGVAFYGPKNKKIYNERNINVLNMN